MIHFAYTIIYVDDVEQTINFFERAFHFNKRFITPEKDYGELDTGATILSFGNRALAQCNFKEELIYSQNNQPPVHIELAFTSTDIHNDWQHAIENGAIAYRELEDKPWGQTMGYIRSPEGLLIELCTPMDYSQP